MKTPSRGWTRREILAAAAFGSASAFLPSWAWAQAGDDGINPALSKDWLARWEKNILADSRNRYCDRETGEELGWLVSPFLNGFYWGFAATGDTKWIDLLADWGEAWTRRGVNEPDGLVGWPKEDGASTEVVPGLYTDNQLGEAMALRPMAMMADKIARTPALKAKYGAQAAAWLALAERVFEKWDARGCWRETKNGGVWVVPVFGIDRAAGGWTASYARRASDGFSHPANKQNVIAQWLLALADATGKSIYRERAEKWFREMQSRMRLRDGKYFVWNYWDPAGPWDFKPDGTTKHWVGVHPNGGYYGIDVAAIAEAFAKGIDFERPAVDRLIATNRDFMWDQKIEGAKFQRIDGGPADDRWKDSPGVLWTGLLPFDATLRKIFEANHKPDVWGGLAETPRYIAARRAATLPLR